MDEQMRLRPRPRLNSLAWLVWHMTRAEDVDDTAAFWRIPQCRSMPSEDGTTRVRVTKVNKAIVSIGLAIFPDWSPIASSATRFRSVELS
jgi:hypothetical protein